MVPDSLTSLHALLNKLRADEIFARATVAAPGGASDVRDTVTWASTYSWRAVFFMRSLLAFPHLQLSAPHAQRKQVQRNTDI
jgi:hypothetical protein